MLPSQYTPDRKSERPITHLECCKGILQLAQRNGWQTNARNADRLAANVRPVIERIQASGITSLRGIAKELTARNVATARGGQWTPVKVTGILHREL